MHRFLLRPSVSVSLSPPFIWCAVCFARKAMTTCFGLPRPRALNHFFRSTFRLLNPVHRGLLLTLKYPVMIFNTRLHCGIWTMNQQQHPQMQATRKKAKKKCKQLRIELIFFLQSSIETYTLDLLSKFVLCNQRLPVSVVCSKTLGATVSS